MKPLAPVTKTRATVRPAGARVGVVRRCARGRRRRAALGEEQPDPLHHLVRCLARRGADRRPEADLDAWRAAGPAGLTAHPAASGAASPRVRAGDVDRHDREVVLGGEHARRPSAAGRRCRRASACPRRRRAGSSRADQPVEVGGRAGSQAARRCARPARCRTPATRSAPSRALVVEVVGRGRHRRAPAPPAAAARAGSPACPCGSSGWPRTPPAPSTPSSAPARSPPRRV